ncbi:MAG: LamG domain-containing protein, partial [Thermoplasmata archaeon]|nr:LamG domain-containing protein [Thermoplasmata archaeon]
VVSPAVGATITLEGWFYVNALTGNPQIIVACGDDALTAGTGWGLSMSNTQHMLFQVGTGAAWATNWAQTGNVTLNAWHFITARYDNTATPKTAVYIDGAVVAGTDIGVGGNIASPNARSAVGAYYSSTSDYIGFFNGYIDEVRVSNNARTLANHVATYGGGAGIQFTLDANATSLWHFSEGTGNPADATANHNDLTAVNTPTWSGNSPIAGGTVLVSSAVISVGVRTITPYIFGGRLGIMVDGVATSIAYAANITNNNDPWNLLTGNIMPYANSINITQGITLRGSWAWEYGATFTDLSLNGNTATPSFRTTSSDADVSASLISLQPVTEAEYTSVTATSASGIVIGTPSAPLKLYTDEDYSKIPGADAINAMIDASGTTPEERIPREMWWFPFIFGIIGISGLCIYGVTTHEGAQGTLWAPIIVIEVGYVVAGLLNPIGFFCAILFLLPAITCLTADKHYSMG